jgi:hypothetical protein
VADQLGVDVSDGTEVPSIHEYVESIKAASGPEAQAAEARRIREERDTLAAKHAARHAELLASPDPVVRAVAALHDPGELFTFWLGCKGCDPAGMGAEEPQWPCRTWVLLDETVAANA